MYYLLPNPTVQSFDVALHLSLNKGNMCFLQRLFTVSPSSASSLQEVTLGSEIPQNSRLVGCFCYSAHTSSSLLIIAKRCGACKHLCYLNLDHSRIFSVRSCCCAEACEQNRGRRKHAGHPHAGEILTKLQMRRGEEREGCFSSCSQRLLCLHFSPSPLDFPLGL